MVPILQLHIYFYATMNYKLLLSLLVVTGYNFFSILLFQIVKVPIKISGPYFYQNVLKQSL